MMALFQDFGDVVKGEVWGDAGAALGIINRKGLGKIRHIQTGLLWIQQIAAEQRLRYAKVPGKENPADLYTKFLDATTNNAHVQRLEYVFVEGRSAEAPKLHAVSQSIDSYRYGTTEGMCEWAQTLIQHVEERKYRPNRRGTGSGLYSLTNNEDLPRTYATNQKVVNCTKQYVTDAGEGIDEHHRHCGMGGTRIWRHNGNGIESRAILRSGQGAGLSRWQCKQNGLEQSVLQGYIRQVQGSTGLNSAQFVRP